MFKVIFCLGYLILADAQLLVRSNVDYSDNSAPTPYQFSYTSPAIGGSSSHQESGDGNGRVTGSYSVEDEDGRSRIVEYVADEDGFRAAISTNEPGTANQNPADVTIASSADDGHGGVQVLEAPTAAVAPTVPARSPTPRNPPAPAPVPVRRPALVPIQPAFFPVAPTLVPIQPSLFPTQPAFIPSRRFFTEPAVFPIGAGRFVPRPPVFRFESRRVAAPPTLIPIQEAPFVADPFFDRNFFGPLDRDILI